MSDTSMSVQCEVSYGPYGSRKHVAWLPKRFARVGSSVKIDDVCDDGVVTMAWSAAPTSALIARAQDHAKHRDFSDA